MNNNSRLLAMKDKVAGLFTTERRWTREDTFNLVLSTVLIAALGLTYCIAVLMFFADAYPIILWCGLSIPLVASIVVAPKLRRLLSTMFPRK